jgi:gamma-glutamylputrescine oxidase
MSDGNTAAAGWYEATRVAHPERPPLNVELDVDVCVIGAGFAGLTTAREIARRGWSVAILEAGTIAWAASGRNTGFVLPGFGAGIEDIVERVGLDHAKQLWALSEQGLDYVRRTIEETAMPGVDLTPGWLHISKTDNDSAVRADVERLRWIGADVEYWPAHRVREQLANPRYFNAAHYRNAFHIHPLNYALGLAAAAEAQGVRIFEHTPAVSIDPAGVRKRIATPNARVRATHVVLAGNVSLGALMPRLAATLLPVSTFVMVTEPIGAHLNEIIRYRGAVSDTNRADNHYRIVGGANPGEQRLQWSGRMRATLGRTVHRMPQIGEIERGVWVASGFGGHGLNTTAMGGELVARGLVEGDQAWRLFAPYELVWSGGRLGRAVAQGIYWGTRPADHLAQAMSRHRERARARKEARLAARKGAAPAQ